MSTSRTRSAVIWSSFDVLLRQGLTFVITVILARMVTPEEFGTIGLLVLFAGVASVFVDSGFSSALIQRQEITHADESTVFWFNLMSGIVIGALLWFSAPWIADFYEVPVLVPLVGVLAFNIMVSASGAIHSTLLTRRLSFKVQLKISGIATGVAGVVAIVMASHGYGLWALAAQTVVASTMTALLLWLLNDWRPAWVFSRESVSKLFGFGGYLMMAGLLDVVYTRLYSVIIGKMYGVADLGFFNRADGARQLPEGILGSVVSRVAFPIFSRAAGDPERIRNGMRLSVRILMFINIPVMLGMSAVAGPMIEAFFGSAWASAAPLLSVLALVSVLWPMNVINVQVLKAQGHSRLFFRLSVIKKLLGVLLLVTGSFFGVMGMVYGILASSLVSFYINAHYSGVYLQYGFMPQVRDFIPVLAVAIPMAVAVKMVSGIWQASAWLELPTMVLLGMALFFGLARMVRLPHFGEVMALLRNKGMVEDGAS